jgi:hypothetical protein
VDVSNHHLDYALCTEDYTYSIANSSFILCS